MANLRYSSRDAGAVAGAARAIEDAGRTTANATASRQAERRVMSTSIPAASVSRAPSLGHTTRAKPTCVHFRTPYASAPYPPVGFAGTEGRTAVTVGSTDADGA